MTVTEHILGFLLVYRGEGWRATVILRELYPKGDSFKVTDIHLGMDEFLVNLLLSKYSVYFHWWLGTGLGLVSPLCPSLLLPSTMLLLSRTELSPLAPCHPCVRLLLVGISHGAL